MTVLIVPDAMASDLRRYAAYNGRIYHHPGPASAPSLRSSAVLRLPIRFWPALSDSRRAQDDIKEGGLCQKCRVILNDQREVKYPFMPRPPCGRTFSASARTSLSPQY
jgi:hypothetical protein